MLPSVRKTPGSSQKLQIGRRIIQNVTTFLRKMQDMVDWLRYYLRNLLGLVRIFSVNLTIMKKILYILAIALLLTSCDWISPGDQEFVQTKKSMEVVSTNNNFGLELFSKILEDEDKPNVMISPASISLALGMAYNGAETTTRDAFDQLLDYEGLTPTEVNEISRDLIMQLVIDRNDNLLEIANSIWHHKDFPIHQSFLDINKTYFDAEVNELDFSSPSAVETINKWVSDNTHKKIEKILEELSPDARMVLINALYYNCLWEYEFDPDESSQKMFYNDDESEFGEVEMMKTESEFNYASTDDFTSVELPYKDGKFSMHLFLPADGTTLDELIQKLDGDAWDSWLGEYETHEKVQVVLPKFKFDYDRPLGPELKEMGIEIAFTEEADFSGISDIPLLITDVFHKTYIDVNEEGTEAAAVTAIVFGITSVGPDDGPIYISFDRPFLFTITENSSSSIVFVGKVAEPGQI